MGFPALVFLEIARACSDPRDVAALARTCSTARDACEQRLGALRVEPSEGKMHVLRASGACEAIPHPKHGPPFRVTNVVCVAETLGAAAATTRSGAVLTWGYPDCGGDCSSVQAQLVGVRSVVASGHAFAALTRDGGVVTWGDPGRGGDCSSVQTELNGVRSVRAIGSSFAALTRDGGVVTWGDPMFPKFQLPSERVT